MPTGYTSGIIDGTTKDFNDFATQCMRAFGATIHMRDESSDKPYEPRVPSDYNKKELKNAKDKLEKADKLTDKELIKSETDKLNANIEYHTKRIVEIKASNKRLNSFLSKAEGFEPPTKEHYKIKEFMIDQLKKTIDFDGDYEYHKKELIQIGAKFKNLNANILRLALIDGAREKITYHTKGHKEELKRCADSNNWVEQFLEALPKTNK